LPRLLHHDPGDIQATLLAPTAGDPPRPAVICAAIHATGGRRSATWRRAATTHYLEEADALCDRILIIDHGRIAAAGTPTGLERRIGGDVVTFEVASVARR
jgi:ABC-2 type transport system ATP-binding protein